MKTVTGSDRKLPPRPVDWDDDDCLCHGPIPEEKKVFFQSFVYCEKQKKKRWKNLLRTHLDCPVHGVSIVTEDRPCREG